MRTLKKIGRLFWLMLHELSDESLYQRHLESHGLTHSPAEWKKFLDHYFQRKFNRPKCC